MVECFTTLFFIAEYYNYRIAKDIIFKKGGTGYQELFEQSYEKLFSIIERKKQTQNNMPYLLFSCLEVGIIPKRRDNYKLLIAQWLGFSSNQLEKDNTTEPTFENFHQDIKPYLNFEGEYKLSRRFTLYKSDVSYGWVSFRYKIPRRKNIKIDFKKKLPVHFTNEPINIISIITDLLIKHNRLNEYTAEHYIQRWIKKQFNICYCDETKIGFSKIVTYFNRSFYGKSQVAHSDFKTTRSASIQPKVIVSKVFDILNNLYDQSEIKMSKSQALGVFLLFRLCKALRVRTAWIKKEIYQSIQTPSNKKLVFRFVRGITCIDALHPLEYNYFQSRSFGSYSYIRGLNFIFRGGLLPYLNEGKAVSVAGLPGSGKTTYALQRMVEIAFYGGFSLYLTFEEDHSILVDRLHSFGLTNYDHYDIIEVDSSNYKKEFSKLDRNLEIKKGVLVLFKIPRDDSRAKIISIIRALSLQADKLEWKYKAITLDSINSMDFDNGGLFKFIVPNIMKRIRAREIIDNIKKNKYLGIILSEQNDPQFNMLPYLCDVAIEVTTSSNSRYFEILKARNQNYQFGKHPFRISDGTGLVIYPSLDAVLSGLRNRVRSTVSEKKIIQFPIEIKYQLKFPGILEKSSTLLYGNARSEKIAFLYQIVGTKDTLIDDTSNNTYSNISLLRETILVVTFRTSGRKYEQMMRGYNKIYKKWQIIPNKKIRHFTPGSDITPEQIIDGIWANIREAKREGRPISRVIIDEIESSKFFLPTVHQSKLFWPTLTELLNTEAITSFFIVQREDEYDDDMIFLKDYMDYIFKVSRKETHQKENPDGHRIELRVDKWIDPYNFKRHSSIKSIAVVNSLLSDKSQDDFLFLNQNLRISGIDYQILKLYSRGVESEDIYEQLKSRYEFPVTNSAVSKILHQVDEEIEKFKVAKLNAKYTGVFIDTIQIPFEIYSKKILSHLYYCIGLNPDMSKNILGFWLKDEKEAKNIYQIIFEDLRERGVKSIRTIIVQNPKNVQYDFHDSFKGATLQRSTIHMLRYSQELINGTDKKGLIKETHKNELIKLLLEITTISDKNDVIHKINLLNKNWQNIYPEVVSYWQDCLPDILKRCEFLEEKHKNFFYDKYIETIFSAFKSTIAKRSSFRDKYSIVRILFLSYNFLLKDTII